jgi:cytidine deaminase
MIDYKKLLEMAYEASKFAYAPYSNYNVGAALLTKSGKIYTGCNVECASYSGTNCAERTALFKAVSEGERDFEAIAIVSSSRDYTFPCGVCRQVLGEFGLDIDIVVAKDLDYKVYKLSELMPHAFTPSELNK